MNYGIITPTDTNLPGGIGQATSDGPHPPGVVVYFTVSALDAVLATAQQLSANTSSRRGRSPAWDA